MGANGANGRRIGVAMAYIEGRDAAYASNIGNFGGIVGGYIGGPNAYHVWSKTDWAMFPSQPKLPIWVAGYNGDDDGNACLAVLRGLGLSKIVIAVDMELRRDISYLNEFAATVQGAGYLILVYGSLSTVFGNPKLNGYWVADWTGQAHMALNPETGDSLGIRGTQYLPDVSPGYDVSVWKEWILPEFWR